MKLGAENKKKVIVAAVLALLGLLAFVRMMSSFGDSSPAPAPNAAQNAALNAATANAPATSRPTRARNRNTRDRKAAPTLSQSLDPRLNFALLEQSERVTYSGTGRNIFKMEEEPVIPPPVASATTAEAPKPQRYIPPQPPGPPSIPLKFYGWASKPGEPRSAFLSSGGGDVFVAREGDVVARRYKIVRIQPNTVEVEDVLTNNRQNLPLTQG